jgi:phosphoribosylformimino-5-aminoimidazole carboxamide ribotide isomerase
MLIIPAVDLKDGQCVRLIQGDHARQTVYSKDPEATARRWVDEGAGRLHVVDLDGALGTGDNLDAVLKIRRAVKCEIEFGGGLRHPEPARKLLDAGVDMVVIGTAVLDDPKWARDLIWDYPGRVMAALDARGGEVLVKGWKTAAGRSSEDVLKLIEDMGFREIICTDVGRDGMLSGVNIADLKKVLAATSLSVYASGGVSSLEDIRSLQALENERLKGCVVGKALYEGKFSLKDALALG